MTRLRRRRARALWRKRRASHSPAPPPVISGTTGPERRSLSQPGTPGERSEVAKSPGVRSWGGLGRVRVLVNWVCRPVWRFCDLTARRSGRLGEGPVGGRSFSGCEILGVDPLTGVPGGV